MRTKKAYSFLELMMVVSVLAIISVSAFNGLNAIRKNHAIEEDEAGIDIREIAKQEFLLQGIVFDKAMDPFSEYGTVECQIEKTSSDLNIPGKSDVSLWSINFDAKDRERINVVGKVIKDAGSPQEVIQTTQLSPPIAHFSGVINLKKFPIKKFIVAANNNPLGTYYRYTTDGSDPAADSKVWHFSSLSLSQWAPRMKFRAFNSDPKYIESSVLEVITAITGNVELKREDGKNDTAVSYWEIVNGTNRLVLTVPGSDSSAQIQYRIQGGNNIDYTGPFHFPLNAWDSGSVRFIAEIKLPQHHKPIGTQEFNLQIKKQKLDPPEIIADCDSNCLSGSKVRIKVDRTIASTITTVEGQDGEYYLEVEEL